MSVNKKSFIIQIESCDLGGTGCPGSLGRERRASVLVADAELGAEGGLATGDGAEGRRVAVLEARLLAASQTRGASSSDAGAEI